MRGFGTHFQPPGTWSDDGALVLCSVHSLSSCKGFNSHDMAKKFLRWKQDALWTATGRVFDIGTATAHALGRVARGIQPQECGGKEEFENGNGSLMRIMPLSLYRAKSDDIDSVADASAITHAHPRSKLACEFHALFVRSFFESRDLTVSFQETQKRFGEQLAATSETRNFRRILLPDFASIPRAELGSSGYVIDTLEASFWCLLNHSTFAETVLAAVNLGEDTDTTGCVAGGLAGLVHGISTIPVEWRNTIPQQGNLSLLFNQFLPLCP